ncbi:hypothetical protein CJ030_MR3G015824 [Morella rubra]|uniref:Uncharacterized protein n=1 Tax=Morella rubra TaxID=262757 RepID=A0A6A1W5U0_9ROSI|nr:hypothetical protein CJ030_MR3G015824 [Morella rubra]
MAEHLKLRFARAMTSFQFCRSKDPSTFPEIPSPASYPLCPINPKALDTVYPNLPAPPSTPEHPLHKRRESSKIISIGCSTGSSADHTRKKESQRKKNEQIGTSIRVGGWFCSEGEADRESETLMSSSIKNEIQTAKKARSRGHALRSESTHEARAFMIPCTVFG